MCIIAGGEALPEAAPATRATVSCIPRPCKELQQSSQVQRVRSTPAKCKEFAAIQPSARSSQQSSQVQGVRSNPAKCKEFAAIQPSARSSQQSSQVQGVPSNPAKCKEFAAIPNYWSCYGWGQHLLPSPHTCRRLRQRTHPPPPCPHAPITPLLITPPPPTPHPPIRPPPLPTPFLLPLPRREGRRTTLPGGRTYLVLPHRLLARGGVDAKPHLCTLHPWAEPRTERDLEPRAGGREAAEQGREAAEQGNIRRCGMGIGRGEDWGRQRRSDGGRRAQAPGEKRRLPRLLGEGASAGYKGRISPHLNPSGTVSRVLQSQARVPAAAHSPRVQTSPAALPRAKAAGSLPRVRAPVAVERREGPKEDGRRHLLLSSAKREGQDTQLTIRARNTKTDVPISQPLGSRA